MKFLHAILWLSVLVIVSAAPLARDTKHANSQQQNSRTQTTTTTQAPRHHQRNPSVSLTHSAGTASKTASKTASHVAPSSTASKTASHVAPSSTASKTPSRTPTKTVAPVATPTKTASKPSPVNAIATPPPKLYKADTSIIDVPTRCKTGEQIDQAGNCRQVFNFDRKRRQAVAPPVIVLLAPVASPPQASPACIIGCDLPPLQCPPGQEMDASGVCRDVWDG